MVIGLFRALAASCVRMLSMFVTADAAHLPYEAHFASPVFSSLSPSMSPARDDRLSVLPPVQPAAASCQSAADDLESPCATGLPPCNDDEDDEDDSVPPVVRFKNRYRRAQQLEQQQQQQQRLQQYYETTTLRDWNDNVTGAKLRRRQVNTNWSAPEDCRHTADDVYYDTSPPKVSPDPDLEKISVAEESRTCEKRTWSRITPEVDLSDPWMASRKIACRDDTADARRPDAGLDTEQRETDELLKQYQQIHPRSLEYQNCVDNRAEANCKPHSLTVIFYSFIVGVIADASGVIIVAGPTKA